ncbi:acyl-CoA dehydrogenase [Embleya scabrispora]|uniref:Acyl-CoA dehydrogenase n=1 Tax=Embleya scabrispora TaxID=159449 RepID=A0A1T3NVD1_9ACTN|nr:acyl-CoA dehydrogenase [Embleya scabrispora]OPC80809.1 acyl-CoA dehydrogenase [Embleya scabrispora]
MAIGITEEHRSLAESVRGWVQRVAPIQEVRRVLEADGEERPGHWPALAEQGLLGMHVAEEFGGAGYGLVETAVALEQAGLGMLPGPFLPTVLASALLQADGGDAAKELLPGLVDGTLIGAVAAGPGTVTAAEEAGGLRVSGVATPILGGALADVLVLAARRADGDVVYVAVDAPDVDVRALKSVDPTRRGAEVTVDTVVPATRVLAGVDETLARDLAAVLMSAEACGVAAWALDTATEYAKVREQFGRPIGQFQAIKHLCADMLVRVEQSRAVTWDAARAFDAGSDAPTRSLTAAIAATYAIEAAFTTTKDCVQILGGIGFTWEHDAHIYLRRGLTLRQYAGPAAYWRLRVTELASAGARRDLVLDLPEEAERLRDTARAILAEVAGESGAEQRARLAPLGYAAPYLPKPYGIGAGPVEQLVIQQEMKALGVRLPDITMGNWVIPSLIAYGTPAQQERFAPPTLRGEIQWCQLFSEPGAGSDLAAISTRATRTEGGWLINGQKVWTSRARESQWGILLARTSPDKPKHEGLTYFIVDMASAGLDIRPLKEISGLAMFNEIFLEDLFVPDEMVVGEVDGGWQVARNTLGNERVHMGAGSSFGAGIANLVAAVNGPAGEFVDGGFRERLGALVAEASSLALIELRTTLARLSGLEPGAGASVRKLVGTPHQQRESELSLELLGPLGAVDEGEGQKAAFGFLMSRCLTIAGGTTQVQLNVVGERILGLPRDPQPSEK